MLKRIEAGIVTECDWEETKRQRALLKIGQRDSVYFRRTFKWFFSQFFKKQCWGMYSGSCNCFFIDIGPFFITFLGKECAKAKVKTGNRPIVKIFTPIKNEKRN
jgi:hypothetical protein